MPKISFKNAAGEVTEIEAQVGESLMQAAVDNGVDEILAECGGACACATCHCYVDSDWAAKLPAADDMEQEMLKSSEYHQEGSRLSCQITVTEEMDGMEVGLPESQY